MGPISINVFSALTCICNLGEAELDRVKIPTRVPSNFEGNAVVQQELTCPDGQTYTITVVKVGSPHTIIFVDNLEEDVDYSLGPKLDWWSEIFPQGTNVEFVKVLSGTHVDVTMYERDVKGPLRLASAACAVAAAAEEAGKVIDRDGLMVGFTGCGHLTVRWDEEDGFSVSGPASFSFSGTAIVE